MTVTQAVDTDEIPADLIERPQWVVWRLEERDGKPTKVPYTPGAMQHAKADDPATWRPFREATATLARGYADGIGYVFSADDPYVGIDLDKCIDQDGTIAGWADDIISQIDTYTEVSPSGRGIHMIAKGRLPATGRRKGPIEMYDSGRYFTITGWRVGNTPAIIEDRDAEILALHSSLFAARKGQNDEPPAGPALTLGDEDLLTRARNAANGHKFDRLYRGDSGEYQDDESAADQAFCNILAFYTRDEQQIDRIFRRSGRYRKKWDTKHRSDGSTYGRMTIANALGFVQAGYNPSAHSRNGHDSAAAVVEVPMPKAETQPAACPPLPDEAAAAYRYLEEGAGAWLDSYINFASQAAPMTPHSFHEAAGLFAGAVAIARRLVLRISTTAIYPNLFTLFIAPSTVYSKTTGLKIVTDLFGAAGMHHFLLPQRMTPEAMVQELSLGVPPNLGLADHEARQQWMKERALAAKRGWAIDEASSLLDSLKRDFNTGLLAMMLNLYECPEKTTEQTIGRWRVTVHRAYLSFFGAATPAGMADHLANQSFWTNGLWARFALVIPDEAPRFQFFPDQMEIPNSIVAGLHRLASLFPMPEASLIDVEDPDGTKRKVIEVTGEGEPSSVMLVPGVRDAWETYARVLHSTLTQNAVEPELFGSYGRMHVQAIKIAMILAAMDACSLPVRVEMRHWAKAQEIVERRRNALHQLRAETAVTKEETVTDKILGMLTGAHPTGLVTRDIYRPLNMSSAEVRSILDELTRQGLAERIMGKAANGRSVEMWRRSFIDLS